MSDRFDEAAARIVKVDYLAASDRWAVLLGGQLMGGDWPSKQEAIDCAAPYAALTTAILRESAEETTRQLIKERNEARHETQTALAPVLREIGDRLDEIERRVEALEGKPSQPVDPAGDGPAVHWIVTDGNDPNICGDGEFGVAIGGVAYLYYKHASPEPCGDDVRWRVINKREFGEVIRRPGELPAVAPPPPAPQCRDVLCYRQREPHTIAVGCPQWSGPAPPASEFAGVEWSVKERERMIAKANDVSSAAAERGDDKLLTLALHGDWAGIPWYDAARAEARAILAEKAGKDTAEEKAPTLTVDPIIATCDVCSRRGELRPVEFEGVVVGLACVDSVACQGRLVGSSTAKAPVPTDALDLPPGLFAALRDPTVALPGGDRATAQVIAWGRRLHEENERLRLALAARAVDVTPFIYTAQNTRSDTASAPMAASLVAPVPAPLAPLAPLAADGGETRDQAIEAVARAGSNAHGNPEWRTLTKWIAASWIANAEKVVAGGGGEDFFEAGVHPAMVAEAARHPELAPKSKPATCDRCNAPLNLRGQTRCATCQDADAFPRAPRDAEEREACDGTAAWDGSIGAYSGRCGARSSYYHCTRLPHEKGRHVAASTRAQVEQVWPFTSLREPANTDPK